MESVKQKLLDAIQVTGAVEHAVIVESLDHREKLQLLNTVHDMEKSGLIRRDNSEKREGRRVLKYVAVVPVTPAPTAPSGSVNNAPSA